MINLCILSRERACDELEATVADLVCLIRAVTQKLGSGRDPG
jgi:hypothetical protein